jgi:limonene-1,2-epoxide hydrolase
MDRIMPCKPSFVTRRKVLTSAGLGAAAMAGFSGRLEGAAWTPAEKANVQTVNAFCAVWPSHDIAKIMSFFADACAYRAAAGLEPAKGRDAVKAFIATFIDRIEKFDVLDTFAKGPMVVNERTDSMNSGAPRSWPGVGVFYLKDGKIVEWSDYAIEAERP